MTGRDVPGTPTSGVRDEAARRRRLAAVFGDVLPETSSDERDDNERASEIGDEDWLRAQVPPHHG